MTGRLKVAVVGAGFFGKLHARVYAESDAVELAAVVDPNVESGSHVARKYGAHHANDVRELLEDDSIQTYTVAMPDRMHVAVASKILEAGRAVLLEKPMADTLEGARRIALAAERGGGRLMVGHICRFDPRYVGAAQAVASGSIGDPVHVSASRFGHREAGERMAGSSSVCFYVGVHDVDAIQWVSGKRVTRVYSRAVSKIMPSAGIESEDAIFTTCELEDGAIGALHFGWSLPQYMPSNINARLEVVGTDGVVQLDVHDHGLRVINASGVTLPDGLHWPDINGRLWGDLAAEVNHFIQCLRDDKEFAVPVHDAMRAVAVNDAILRSVESGQPERVETV
jgi:predicted dehydrogenase